MDDFREMLGDLFGGGMFDSNTTTSLEYRQYKGSTPYKLVKLQSGYYGIVFDEHLLNYRYDNKEEAQKFFIYLCKNYKGV